MGEMIQFNRPDGKTCPGYLVDPNSGSSAPGFVVIQEWWGLLFVPRNFRGNTVTLSVRFAF